MLETYCIAFADEQRKLQTIVGLALDIYSEDGVIKTRSEDLVAMDAPDWTPALKAKLAAARVRFGLKDPRDLKVHGSRMKVKNPFRLKKRSEN
jgi:hypothetical protein